MIPLSIADDPQQPDASVIMRAPPGTESWCGDLKIRIAVKSGQVGFMAEWYPTPEELERLKDGAAVRTFIVGRSLPPQSVWVKGVDEV
jgi:hypothetical protein